MSEVICVIGPEIETRSVVSNSLGPHGLILQTRTGVGSLSLLQGIFPTKGSNPGLPHCRRILYQRRHKGSPRILEWVAYPFSRGPSQPRNRTGVPWIAGRFFTSWSIREASLGLNPSSNSSGSHIGLYIGITWDFKHPDAQAASQTIFTDFLENLTSVFLYLPGSSGVLPRLRCLLPVNGLTVQSAFAVSFIIMSYLERSLLFFF